MIVDPWGTVIAQAPDAVGIIRADIETDRVAAVRRQISVLANRRFEGNRRSWYLAAPRPVPPGQFRLNRKVPGCTP
jgi:hypothetical protein